MYGTKSNHQHYWKRTDPKMILAGWPPPICPFPTKFSQNFNKPTQLYSHNIFSDFSARSTVKATFKCCCSKNPYSYEGFSVLPSDTPWDNGSIWSTLGSYFFGLHFPLSFGGLSVVAQIMHQPVLDPQLEAVSILLIQSIELWGALALLRFTAKSHFKLASFFPNDIHSNQRSWVQASALGFIILISVALFTSLLADRLIGPKVVNNTILKDILSSGSISEVAFFLTYCFVTPLLEETVYRGFLLASLTSTMEWPQAVVISSCIFSLAHLSIENSLQLFIIGCVLACSYCWSGNLGSSLVLHSLYNALTLILTILSFKGEEESFVNRS